VAGEGSYIYFYLSIKTSQVSYIFVDYESIEKRVLRNVIQAVQEPLSD